MKWPFVSRREHERVQHELQDWMLSAALVVSYAEHKEGMFVWPTKERLEACGRRIETLEGLAAEASALRDSAKDLQKRLEDAELRGQRLAALLVDAVRLMCQQEDARVKSRRRIDMLAKDAEHGGRALGQKVTHMIVAARRPIHESDVERLLEQPMPDCLRMEEWADADEID